MLDKKRDKKQERIENFESQREKMKKAGYKDHFRAEGQCFGVCYCRTNLYCSLYTIFHSLGRKWVDHEWKKSDLLFCTIFCSHICP